ncbi:group I truncated hemoglobin [[Mycobacterium] nativiensis]|uniref:Group 1 truncated hemoglobin n=1 Tax=[Mycobacterium] nativiensis TaxID=2855503 RepID=A0ABU5XYZ7_9MYCO|nr:group 1 truncated hemoglobin [Mycolicibacter sp. MYC340]MEB3032982.1 group 1 truncated hemoglobin [Mycolicibacter sp. MYC340]
MTCIYQEIGGDAALTAVVEDFYARVLADARLAGYFRNSDMARLERKQVAFLAAALGGPEPYRGLSMADAHRGRNIGRLQFDLVVGHLTAALTSCGVPESITAEIMAAVAPLSDDIVTNRHSAALG